MRQDAVAWAESEFQGTPGLNIRYQRRLIATAAKLATRPQGTLPHRLPTWPELKGCYRLVHAVAHPDSVQSVHRERTRERMAAVHTPLLVIHDPTQLDFSSHPTVADQLGPIGDGSDFARGFQQHNSLVVDPERQELLGLIHQQTFLRKPRPAGETRAARYQRTDRESQIWMRGIEAVGRPGKGQVWVHVGDRGADIFGAMVTARRQNTHFLFRLVQNRQLQAPVGPDDDPSTHLLKAARQVEATTRATVEIASRGGRPGRTATVNLGAVRLAFRATRADPLWRNEPSLTITVIRIWEENPPPDVEPLEWILGTDLDETSPEALLKYQSWYQWRWRTMEEYHKAQKTGLRMEDLRFETRQRLETAIAILSVIAVRILQLRWARDSCPDASASLIASEQEIHAVESVRPGKPVVTVKQFIDRVAGLGGFLGRKCDGRPGWQALWRGYQRLADILLGMALPKQPSFSEPTECG